MTESQWLTAKDPRPLLRFANRTDVLRRFAVACVRALSDWPLPHGVYGGMVAQLWPDVLDVAERIAAQRASRDEVGALVQKLDRLAGGMTLHGDGAESGYEMQHRLLAAAFSRRDAEEVSYWCVYGGYSMQLPGGWHDLEHNTVREAVRPSERQSRLLALHATFARDLIGNPFRPVDVDPSWLTDTVLALARRADEAGDLSILPILADALSDAGCDEADLLDHCRSNGPHVRGCWALNLVLERVRPPDPPQTRSGVDGALSTP